MKDLVRLALTLMVTTVALLAPVAHAANIGNHLNPGQTLAAGDWLQSANGQFRFVMQFDGNLVLYRTRDNRPLWASGTYGIPVSNAIMQGDGNLVIYGYPSGSLAPIWASGTQGNPYSHLDMQDDGNVVIYRPSWATNTSGQY
jgi:hypothetical protein